MFAIKHNYVNYTNKYTYIFVFAIFESNLKINNLP